MSIKNTTSIFVDCHVFDSGFQGTRTYIKGLYSELIKKRDLHFFLVSSNPDYLESIFGSHSNVTYLKYKYHNKYLRLLIDVPKIIKKNKIDFAHFQYTVSPIKRCKYIVTTHDVLFIDFPEYFTSLSRIVNTFLYKQSAKRSEIKLTVSEYSKQKIQQHFAVSNYEITPNAIHDTFFEEYDKQQIKAEVEDKFSLKNYIIYVSRWEQRKNHQMVLKAFLDLKLYKNYKLLFLGNDTSSNQEYDDIFDKLDSEIKNEIVSLKNTDLKTMLLLLRGANASVYPSLAEGFGIPPLESVAAKIPTICSNKTAMSDFSFFEDYYFEPYNQDEFNQKLQKILTQNVASDFETMAQKIKEKYSWQKSADILYQLIKKHE
ncbi:glycosyltransferase family 4 protein [Flavobacterium sharifuzzamanii]|uniref:glycosyltransferase family 4 protein n=1 Tax=Flavobacterium sharifuzzamanii TaxID=2211133 RepID=UPI000DAB7608|nr:glycosyltransferase family 1 protein [Flavobacterium sharifuzzamanii]KAF2082528.1 glycosyltransferase family 4 protein [Flavobacterium sharifuzzamanii]